MKSKTKLTDTDLIDALPDKQLIMDSGGRPAVKGVTGWWLAGREKPVQTAMLDLPVYLLQKPAVEFEITATQAADFRQGDSVWDQSGDRWVKEKAGMWSYMFGAMRLDTDALFENFAPICIREK